MRRMLFGAALALCVVTAWNEPRHGIGYNLQGALAGVPQQVRLTAGHVIQIYDNFNQAGAALSH